MHDEPHDYQRYTAYGLRREIDALYSPLKLVVPASAAFFLLGAGYYAYTYITENRFTNMSMLLFSASVIIFLIGLISEQITALTYRRGE